MSCDLTVSMCLLTEVMKFLCGSEDRILVKLIYVLLCIPAVDVFAAAMALIPVYFDSTR